MSLVENDLRLIAWYAWGLNLLFKEYSKEEMFNYIGKASEEELEKHIQKVDKEIRSESSEGIILDKNFKLLENDKIVGLFNIENESNPYSFEEKEARSIDYICSLIFWEKGNIEGLDKDHYRYLKPPTSLWIYPKVSKILENTINVSLIPLPLNQVSYHFGKTKTKSYQNPNFKIIAKVYHCYIGDPSDINLEYLNENNDEDKLGYVVLLSDLIFGFKINKQKRIQMAHEIFNLKKSILEKEVNTMEALNSFEERLISYGFKQGEKIGISKGEEIGISKGEKIGINKGKNEDVEFLIKYLINESNGTLSFDKAKEKALKILNID